MTIFVRTKMNIIEICSSLYGLFYIMKYKKNCLILCFLENNCSKTFLAISFLAGIGFGIVHIFTE